MRVGAYSERDSSIYSNFLYRFASLLLVAGGSGITPFLSILAEVDSAASRNRFPLRIQLVYVIKKAQDFSLLHSISHMLLKESTENFHLNLKLFVTQETQEGMGIRELFHELFKVRTLELNSFCSSYAAHGPESPAWMAAIAGFCSITFLIFLIMFNHIIIPSEKPSKLSKVKTASWVVDLVLIAAFVLALACSTLVAVILRCRRLKKGIQPISQKEIEPLHRSAETSNALEEHEVHFGKRPDFKDICSKFRRETSGSNIGVLVCGPETMKESVASACQQKSQCFKLCVKTTEPSFTFHSLNFTL